MAIFAVLFYQNTIYIVDLVNVSLLPSRFYGNAYYQTRYFPEQTWRQKVIFHVTNLFDSIWTGNEKKFEVILLLHISSYLHQMWYFSHYLSNYFEYIQCFSKKYYVESTFWLSIKFIKSIGHYQIEISNLSLRIWYVFTKVLIKEIFSIVMNCILSICG